MAQFLRSFTLLCAVGASAALFLQELVGSWLVKFISANTLTLANRQRVLLGMVAGAALAAAAGIVASAGGSHRVRRLAHLLAPGLLLGFVPPLWTPAAWPNTFNLALVLALFVLLAERLFRMACAAAVEPPPAPPVFVTSPVPADAAAPPFGRLLRLLESARQQLTDAGTGLLSPRARRYAPVVLVVACALGYAVYMSVFTLYMHGRFQTYGYDLGQYDNVFWSTLHGYPLRDAPLGFDTNWSELRGHADLATFFFLPIYAIKPGGAILLVIQSCVLGFGAIPIYRFSARRLPRAYAAAIAIAYLLYPPMHGLQFYDFHFQPIATAFVLMVIDFVDDRRYWLCGMAFAVALCCREDVSVGLAILGTFLALTGHRIRPGLTMAAAATAYFVVMRFFIMPSFGAWGFQDVYKELFPQGAPNFSGIIATMVTNPLFTLVSLLEADKLRYALQILVPLAFLPLRRSYLIVSFIPGSMFTLLSTKYAPTIDIGFQYSGHFLPYLFPAAALSLAAYGSSPEGLVRRRAGVMALAAGTVFCGVFWGAIPPRDHIHGGFNEFTMRAPTAAERQKHKDLVELHASIPKDASVAISEAEMPHVSRLWMRSLRDTTDADYLLYGVGAHGSGNAERALSAGEFEKIAERPGLVLLKRKSTPPPPSPDANAAPPGPAAPMGPAAPTKKPPAVDAAPTAPAASGAAPAPTRARVPIRKP